MPGRGRGPARAGPSIAWIAPAARGGRGPVRGRARRRTALAIAAAAGLVGALAIAARPVLVLEIGAPGADAAHIRRTVRPGETLTYRFIHSVSQTPVTEEWAVVSGPEGPALRLRTTTYQATGAGLPSAPDEPGATFEATAAGFTIRGLDRPIGLPLDLRVTPAARNALLLAGEAIDLTALPAADGKGPASLVRLTLRRTGWLAAWLHAGS